jgi:hypothetical protein
MLQCSAFITESTFTDMEASLEAIKGKFLRYFNHSSIEYNGRKELSGKYRPRRF